DREPAGQLSVQLILVGILCLHQPDLQTLRGTHNPVAVRNELVFGISRGNTEECLPRTAGAGSRNVILAVRQLYTEQCNGNRIDIGTIACDSDRSSPRWERTCCCTQPLRKVRSLAVTGDGKQCRRGGALTGDAVELPCTLIAAKEEDLVFHDRAA